MKTCHPMKKTLLPFAFVSAIALSAGPLGAATLLNDSFADGSYTNQSLPSSSAWYYANTAGTVTASAATNVYILDNNASGSLQTWTYFTDSGSQALAVGETLSVTFNFDLMGTVPTTVTDGALRFGLFDSGGTRVTANQTGSIANSNWNTDTGYSAFVNVNSLSSDVSSNLRQRASGISDTLWAAAATTTLSSSAPGVIDLGSTSDFSTLRYSATLSLTRSSSTQVDLLTTIKSSDGSTTYFSLTGSDTSGLTTTFDTFSIFIGQTVAQDFAIDNVNINIVPEPATWGLLAFGLAATMAFRRRRMA